MNFSMSPEIGEIAKALAAAQSKIENAIKSGVNPHFKSSYAKLSDIWDVIREPLSSNGISVTQIPSADGQKVTITTIMMHSSGQWIAGSLTIMSSKNDAQGVGSAITYGRRYMLLSMCGVADGEDDDGNAASAKPTKVPALYNPQNGYDKKKLMDLFDKYKIDEPAEMKRISDKLVGTPINMLEKALQENI